MIVSLAVTHRFLHDRSQSSLLMISRIIVVARLESRCRRPYARTVNDRQTTPDSAANFTAFFRSHIRTVTGFLFSENTFYRWKSKFGGMVVSDAKRLRMLDSASSNPISRSRMPMSRVSTANSATNASTKTGSSSAHLGLWCCWVAAGRYGMPRWRQNYNARRPYSALGGSSNRTDTVCGACPGDGVYSCPARAAVSR